MRWTMSRANLVFIAFLAGGLVACGGCAKHRSINARSTIGPAEYYQTVGLTQPVPLAIVVAQVAPPLGWRAEPLKQSERHTHQVWLSPTGKTAYGVMHIKLPLPVGVNLVHWEFLREMQKREGDAVELSHQADPALPGLRFVCEGGRYRLRVNLIVRGFEGWAIYATTRREE